MVLTGRLADTIINPREPIPGVAAMRYAREVMLGMQHVAAWLIWACSAAVLALTIRNPLYLTLIALAVWLVQLALAERATTPAGWRGLLKLGALVWLFTIPFNALMMHEGTHVLFRLPGAWPLVGGAITLEAVLSGFVSGLALWTLLLIFATFNIAVDATELLRMLPAALYQAGTVASIALTFVPQMLISAREIREAQQIRGHRFRGWRDLLPLLMPLLTTSFEHAIQLAESMESRGFGGSLAMLDETEVMRQRARLLASMGVVLAGMSARSFWPKGAGLGTALLVVGVMLLLYALRAIGRHAARSRYRRAIWQRSDVWGSAVSLVALAVPLVVRMSDKLALVYYPYPPYSLLPSFSPWIGVALVLLVAPALAEMAGWMPQTPPTLKMDGSR